MTANFDGGRTPIVHIGMPKTATTTLQWRLFSCHSEVYYLGRYDGFIFKGQYRRFSACRDQIVQDIMNQIAYKNISRPNIPQCMENLKIALRPAIDGNLVPVWSWESYSTDYYKKRRARAENLKKLFGDAKIIMTLRHPVELLESTYFLVMRRNNIGKCGYRGRPVYFRTIERWLEENFYGEVMPHLEYAQTIKMYMELFGKENVHVLLFEDLIADQEGFIRKVCHIMGIDADEGLALLSGNKDNSRWTSIQLDTLHKIRHSMFDNFRFAISRRRLRRKMLGLDRYGIPLEPAPKAKVVIPPDWQERIFATTAEGNRWLEDVLGLPLEEYGYCGAKDLT